MDALDAVLVDLAGETPRLKASLTRPLPSELRQQLLALTTAAENEIERSAQADRRLGEFSADTVKRLLAGAGIKPAQVQAIGSHGQTIRHAPDADPSYTVQIGDGNTIAQQTGITTVTDFRRRDMVVGGQGAPLVPAFHSALYRRPDQTRVIVNIGGMANISILPGDASQPISGFDTGPGNILMDSWCQARKNRPYDEQGQWAASGTLDAPLLGMLAADPYFRLPPPKSTGREYFNIDWLLPHLADDHADEDVQATLCELTALTLANAIVQYSPTPREVIVCGGGAYNTHLMQRLGANLPGINIESSAATGVEPRWIEAMAFAWLAQQTTRHLAGNLPAVTGASESVILGAIYPGHTHPQN